MKFENAKELICPYNTNNCTVDKCMMWVTTVNGKKEIDRKIEPYDMTPMDIRQWADNLKRSGYLNIGRENGFRDVYVKYEITNEGYCSQIDRKEEF